jgi:hypothetical protein
MLRPDILRTVGRHRERWDRLVEPSALTEIMGELGHECAEMNRKKHGDPAIETVSRQTRRYP